MNIANLLEKLCLAPAPSGYEKESAMIFKREIEPYVDSIEIDRIGNVIATQKGKKDNGHSIMVFAHLDQLGFIVRRIEPNGFIQVDRLGGIPEKILPALRICIRTVDGRFIPGVIANKSHHTVSADEKYRVDPVTSLFIDIGASTEGEAHDMGVEIGCPAIYEPSFKAIGNNNMVSGTSIDNRGGCTALIYAASLLKEKGSPVTVHFVGTVWEEFNIRGAVIAARKLKADIAFCVDIILAGDTPDLCNHYNNKLGCGPTINLYSFHGRGTLNGTIPNERLVKLAVSAAAEDGISLQKFASLGMITDSAYVQMENNGVACLDMGFPCRYTHSPIEVCNINDIEMLGKLIAAVVYRIDSNFDVCRY